MEFYGLLGEKLSHSLSPIIHKLILEKINKEGAYKLFEIEKDNLKEFTNAIKILKIKGCNVTIPYKVEIIKLLDVISDEAKRIGAINTISLVDNKLYGYNTDYYGFGYMLDCYDVKIKDKIAVILGNGGACKACVNYLVDNGVKKIYVVSRSLGSFNNFNEEKVNLISYEELKTIKGDILINSTPVGMYPDTAKSPVDIHIVNNFNVLVDLIYNPKETEFLLMGKKAKKQVVGGLFMLIGQAVKAQEIWQGIDINKNVIRDIYGEIKNLCSQ